MTYLSPYFLIVVRTTPLKLLLTASCSSPQHQATRFQVLPSQPKASFQSKSGSTLPLPKRCSWRTGWRLPPSPEATSSCFPPPWLAQTAGSTFPSLNRAASPSTPPLAHALSATVLAPFTTSTQPRSSQTGPNLFLTAAWAQAPLRNTFSSLCTWLPIATRLTSSFLLKTYRRASNTFSSMDPPKARLRALASM